MKQVTSGCRRAGSVRSGQYNLTLVSTLALLSAAACNGQVLGTNATAETPAGVSAPGATGAAGAANVGGGVAGSGAPGATNVAGVGASGVGTGETPPNAPPSAPQIMPRTEGGFACDPAQKPSTPGRLRRLTAAQWSNTVASLGANAAANGRVNPFDDGLAKGHFSTDVSAVSLPVESLSLLLDAAESLAKDVAPQLVRDNACLGQAKLDKACVDNVFGSFGARAFRRPLAADELARYSDLVIREAATEGNAGAIEMAVAALISSPNFVFRFEAGAGTPDAAGRVSLAPYELASAISYTVLDGPPDASLLAAAKDGTLAAPATVKQQVARLFGATGATPAVKRFFREYLNYAGAATVFKDPKQFPFHNGALLVDDADRFVAQAVAQRKSFLEILLGSASGIVRSQTATSYGLPAGGEPAMTAFPAGQRAGLLTQPAFLVAFSGTDSTSPVHRGRFISETILCSPVPDFPLSQIPPLPAIANATAREKLKAHTEQPQCAACHKQMDVYGLALEQYDHVGRFRATGEGGKVIDASGVLEGAGAEVDGPFSGPAELFGKLSKSPVVRQCFVLQAFRFWMGRDEQKSDGCALKAADEAFSKSNGDVVELFSTILTSEAFLTRTAGSAK
ncbi:MAG TPA: DUF1588 domain-containing protein [Polyangia bacterium]